MKVLRTVILLAALALGAGFARAVTAEEMEQARVITAQLYLRWANDGSGYLDELSPKTMAQLEKSLKKTEQENIRAFKAVKTPGDYASWDKEKLVAYWSDTFFKSPGLLDKGRSAKGRVKSRLNKLSVTAPSAEKKEQPKEEPAAAGGKEIVTLSDSAAAAQDAVQAADSLARAAEQAAIAGMAADSAVAEEKSGKSSGVSVWIYIVALCILVGVVIWLVIFASKSMKSSEEFADVSSQSREPGDEPVRRAPVSDAVMASADYGRDDDSEEDAASTPVRVVSDNASETRLREKYAALLADKNEEIRSLNRQLLDLREENFRLSEENARLVSERDKAARHEAEAVASAALPQRRRRPAQRDIYLGRVNRDGLFVRADKSPVEGKTVYRLTTSDGFTGTFRVIDDTAMQDKMLDNPEEWLARGCVARDIAATDGMEEIITESAGTAVFEDGCWRVLRQAKISYR